MAITYTPCFASSHMDEEHRCRIHSVSPYGCSHFDAHQTNEEADLRSSAGHYQVDLAWKNDHLYARLWLLLKALGRVAPQDADGDRGSGFFIFSASENQRRIRR